jgi:hypothetical protein
MVFNTIDDKGNEEKGGNTTTDKQKPQNKWEIPITLNSQSTV